MNDSLFLIPLNGLAQGRTVRGLRVGKEFFESFDNAEILDAELDVTIETEKSGSYTGIDCRICGNVTVPCDRCLDPLVIPLDAEAKLSVKFGAGEDGKEDDDMQDDREIIWLPEDEAELDMAQIIYDYVCLSLPAVRFHPEGGCNADVLRHLGGESADRDTDEGGSPFSVLKGLFQN